MKYAQKPPIGTPLDHSNNLTNGLLWFAPLWENVGNKVYDVVGNVNLPFTGAIPWKSGALGSGLSFTSTTMYANAVIPPYLELHPPITLVMGVRFLGTFPTGGATIFGLLPSNTGAAQYTAAAFVAASATTMNGYSSNSGAYTSGLVLTPTAGVDYVICMTVFTSTFVMYAYNAFTGALTYKSIASSGTNAPVYSATACVTIGDAGGSNRASNELIYFAGIYNRALSQAETAQWGTNPWQIFGNERLLYVPPSVPTSYPSGLLMAS